MSDSASFANQELIRQHDAVLQAVAKAVVDGFTYDPGHSDLDDEQSISVRMTLGDYRRAMRMARRDAKEKGSAVPQPPYYAYEAPYYAHQMEDYGPRDDRDRERERIVRIEIRLSRLESRSSDAKPAWRRENQAS